MAEIRAIKIILWKMYHLNIRTHSLYGLLYTTIQVPIPVISLSNLFLEHFTTDYEKRVE